jgi:hypothetical protein
MKTFYRRLTSDDCYAGVPLFQVEAGAFAIWLWHSLAAKDNAAVTISRRAGVEWARVRAVFFAGLHLSDLLSVVVFP